MRARRSSAPGLSCYKFWIPVVVCYALIAFVIIYFLGTANNVFWNEFDIEQEKLIKMIISVAVSILIGIWGFLSIHCGYKMSKDTLFYEETDAGYGSTDNYPNENERSHLHVANDQNDTKVSKQIEELKQQIQRKNNIINTMQQKYTENKRLQASFESLQAENNDLKNKLQTNVMGKGAESSFIDKEDFAIQKMSVFRQQTHKNAHDEIVDLLFGKFEDLLLDDDNNQNDASSNFEELIDRMAYEFLFDLLMICYDVMTERKVKICKIIAKQYLNIRGNGQQFAERLINGQLQEQWEDYLKNEMENTYDINVDAKVIVIEDIFEKICKMKSYKDWEFLSDEDETKKHILNYTDRACEICWIMTLMTPVMTFYPNTFRACVENKKNEWIYDSDTPHDLCPGSVKKEGSKIVFFTIPAVMQQHFTNNEKSIQIIKGTVFVHNDEEFIKCVMNDPSEFVNE